MYLFRQNRAGKIDSLITAGLVLAILLIVIAALTLFGDLLDLLDHFRSQIFLFVLGALVAYLIVPLVDMVDEVVPHRAAAVAISYLLLFVALAVFAVLMINPFISQARSLATTLRHPSTNSLQPLRSAANRLGTIQTLVNDQRDAGNPVSAAAQATVRRDLTSVRKNLVALETKRTLPGTTRVPPRLIDPILNQIDGLAADYADATKSPDTFNRASMDRAVAHAIRAHDTATSAYGVASSTPLLLLRLQSWFDAHGIDVDLHEKFGKAVTTLNDEIASLVNNALGIALGAGNLLLSTVLVLIISIYFVSDGARFVRWLVSTAPEERRPIAQYYMRRLDGILGSYLRTQVLLALLAGVLGAAGALVLGIPYAVVIFFSSFLLSLVPVIGPVILPFPPMVIALVFAPWPRPLIFFVWIMVAEQIATNVIGPRMQGESVGIHPLEAMAAALLGFPIAGFLGSFFAVPAVAFLHVVVGQAVHTRRQVRQGGIAPAAASGSHPVRPRKPPPS